MCCSMYYLFVLFYVLFVCKCVLYYCHRVSTQLQLNIILYQLLWAKSAQVLAVSTTACCRRVLHLPPAPSLCRVADHSYKSLLIRTLPFVQSYYPPSALSVLVDAHQSCSCIQKDIRIGMGWLLVPRFRQPATQPCRRSCRTIRQTCLWGFDDCQGEGP
jgi:hypothetical protein